MVRIFSFAFAVVALIAGQTAAQEPNPIKLNGNGDFYGKTVTKNGEETQGIKAQVTLTLDGKTIHSVVSDESGLFSFSDVAPGVYTITATADTYVSTETINVEAPAEPSATTEPVDPASTEPAITLPLEPIADDMSSMYSMPMSSMAAAPSFSSGSGGSSCGGGTGGGSCGRGGFGRLLPLLGLVGLAGLGNNASPAN